MDWITETIAIGNCFDAQDVETLRREGIASILGLTTSLEGVEAQALGVRQVCLVPLIDGAGNDVSDTFFSAQIILPDPRPPRAQQQQQQ